MKGTLALDIDGTVTTNHRSVPPEIVECLEGYAKEGWDIMFTTGRPFFHCVQLFQRLNFTYYIAPQNGAALVEMPNRKVIHKRYLSKDIIAPLDKVFDTEHTDYVIYSGLENHDSVYVRMDRISPHMRQYLIARTREYSEDWHAITSYDLIAPPEFASVKCFCRADDAERIAQRLESEVNLHAPVIADPFDSSYRLIQGTHSTVNKGQVVRDLQKYRNTEALPVIAAGDDNNDRPLLKVADVAIAMETASDDLLALADIRAASAEKLGLIDALKEAVAGV